MKALSRIPVSAAFILLSLVYIPSCALAAAPYSAVTKALPVLLLIAALAVSGRGEADSRQYQLAILALLFSLAGDVLGDFKPVLGDTAFLLQIAFFAFAQVTYAVSFFRFRFWKDGNCSGRALKIGLALLPVAHAAIYGRFILSSIDSTPILIAVAIYLALISLMGITSVLQDRRGYLFFVIGAFLFVASDSILAYNAFVGHVSNAGQWIMYTYYAAQLLLNITLIKR